MSIPRNQRKRGSTSRKTNKKKKRPSVRQGRSRSRNVSVPTSIGRVTNGGMSYSYGSAPYHETHGAGLRLNVQNVNICSIGSDSKMAENRVLMFSGSSGIMYSSAATSKLGDMSSSAPYYFSIWSDDVNTYSYCSTLLGLHSQFVIRRLRVRYNPATTTQASGALAFAALKQQYEITSEETTFKTIKSLPNSVTTPVWQGASFDVIADRDMGKPAQQLFDTRSTYGLGYVPAQCRIVAATTTVATGPTVYGYLTIDSLVVDLYGQRGSLQLSTLAYRDSGLTPVPITRERLESKEAKKDDVVSLEIRENWVRVPPNSPITTSSSSSTSSLSSSSLSSLTFRGAPADYRHS